VAQGLQVKVKQEAGQGVSLPDAMSEGEGGAVAPFNLYSGLAPVGQVFDQHD